MVAKGSCFHARAAAETLPSLAATARRVPSTPAPAAWVCPRGGARGRSGCERNLQDLQQEVGDFVLRRADGIHTYQLAVVVDDAFQGVTGVVRGADLVLSTPRQIFLQRALGVASPEYAHLPVAVDARGRKLSKSDAAAPVHAGDPLPALLQAWRFLGQPPFPEAPANLREFQEQALRNWSIRRVPAARALPVPPRRDRLSGPCA